VRGKISLFSLEALIDMATVAAWSRTSRSRSRSATQARNEELAAA